jgi:anthranilate phosphoribosyltransferase
VDTRLAAMDGEKRPQENQGLGSHDPVEYIRKVGKGKTLTRNLSLSESHDAFSQLLAGRFTPAQTGAFLQALRIKELSQQELDGLMQALEFPLEAIPLLPAGGFTLNLASDTARKGGYASLLAAELLAVRGTSVGVVHSDPMLSGNRASWDGTLDIATANFGRAGLMAPSLISLDVYEVIPALRHLREIRAELGFRSCLHTAEKLLNPWPEKPLVMGISHRHYAERLAENLRQRGLTGKIVLGNHGTPDLVLHKETEVWEVLPTGDIRILHIHPGELGLQPDPTIYSLGSFSKWREEMAREGFGVLGPVLFYHMAFLRYVAGEVSEFKEGLLSWGQLSGVA